MGQITFGTTFADGTTPTGLQVDENVYNSLGPENSFETMNGQLDLTNFDGATDLLTRHFQEGTWTGGKMLGGTVNLDYVSDLFQGFSSSPNPANEDNSYFQAIPGASIRFYLPFSPSVAIFLWSIAVANDGNTNAGTASGDRCVLKFFVDGTAQEHTRRAFGPSIWGTVPNLTRYGGERDRVYCGSDFQADLAVGWHNASLRIAHEFGRDASSATLMRGVGMTRVRVRSIQYVYIE